MTKIKICGLTRNEDVVSANIAKPDFVGFVFAPSRRRVTALQAAELSSSLSREIIPVGVFVDSKVDEIISLFEDKVIQIAQLHGSESAEYIENLKKVCCIPVIKSYKIRNYIPEVLDFTEYSMFDGGAGSGIPFSWDILEGYSLKNTFLAGGVSLENIEKALQFHPFAIDLSSGVETNGQKDLGKMIKICEKVRSFCAR